MHSTKKYAAVAAAIACTFGATAPAEAARLIAYTYTQGAGGYVDDYKDIYGVGPISAHVGSAAASTADFGVLKISTHSVVTANGPGPYATEGAYASAYFEDSVVINSGAAGSAGIATFSLSIDGSLDGSSSGLPGYSAPYDNSFSVTMTAAGAGVNASYQTVYPLSVFFNTSSGPDFGFVKTHGSFNSNGSLEYNTTNLSTPDQAFGTFTFDIPFFSGRAFALAISANCSTNQYSSRTGFGTSTQDCALGHTITWGGLLGVRNAAGAPATATITADSGVNYAENFGTVVPEPAAWALMIAGFGLAGARLRRRAAAA